MREENKDTTKKSNQFLLFDDLPMQTKAKAIIKDIEWVDLSDICKQLHYKVPKPGVYRLYKTGHVHFWGNLDPDLFGGCDYPFIQNMETGKILSYLLYGNYPIARFVIEETGFSGVGLLHRIVACAFIENDDYQNKDQVNHINHNPCDYRVHNLEWISRKDNNVGAIRNKSVSLEDKYYETIGRIKQKMRYAN